MKIEVTATAQFPQRNDGIMFFVGEDVNMAVMLTGEDNGQELQRQHE